MSVPAEVCFVACRRPATEHRSLFVAAPVHVLSTRARRLYNIQHAARHSRRAQGRRTNRPLRGSARDSRWPCFRTRGSQRGCHLFTPCYAGRFNRIVRVSCSARSCAATGGNARAFQRHGPGAANFGRRQRKRRYAAQQLVRRPAQAGRRDGPEPLKRGRRAARRWTAPLKARGARR